MSVAGTPSAARWFGLAAAVVVADQLVKAVVLARFLPGERLELAGFLNLVLVFNKGAAFSFLAGADGWQTPLLAAFAVGAALVLGFLIFKNKSNSLTNAALALVLGGAVGNVIDRLRIGAVVDFVDFHAMGWHFPAFNLADSAITIGAALLIYEGFVHDERPRASS